MFPLRVITALYVPRLVNLVILNIALPLLFVWALYFLPLTFKVTFTFLIAFPLLFFKLIVYFFTFKYDLNLLDLALIT